MAKTIIDLDKKTAISNKVIFDEKLTMRARGILLYLWALPERYEDCEIDMSYLVGGEPSFSLEHGVKDLVNAGYIEIETGKLVDFWAGRWCFTDKAVQLLQS